MAQYAIWKDVPGDPPETVHTVAELIAHAKSNGFGIYFVVEMFRFDNPHLRTQIESSRDWGRIVHYVDGRCELQRIDWDVEPPMIVTEDC